MADTPSALIVRHDAADRRYEVVIDGARAECVYEDDGARRTFTHTFVPPALRGRGVAEALVRAALADARAERRRVVPACSYVAAFIGRHRDYADLLAGPAAGE